jgi:hypothetical protein
MLSLLMALSCTGGTDIEFQEIGTFTTSDTGFLTGEIAIEVPDGASSILVHCGTYGDDKLGLLWTLKNPDGSYLYDGNDPGSTADFKGGSHDDLVPFLIPLADDSPLQAGSYTADIYVQGPEFEELNCGAVLRTGDAPDEGELAVELVFVSVPGLDATSAQDDAAFQSMVESVESMYAGIGITIAWTYTDFAGDVGTYAVVDVTADDFSEFNDLLRTSNPEDDLAVSIFLVEEISTDEGNLIIGKSGGPPGTHATQGTSKSGVVASTIDLADSTDLVATILAHELGHYLGLFHTTERDATALEHDPISDTPECTTDGDDDGKLSTSECDGSGSDNLMWWTYNADLDPVLTTGQGTVVRRGPLVQSAGGLF